MAHLTKKLEKVNKNQRIDKRAKKRKKDSASVS
jgi:hypothetical protein